MQRRASVMTQYPPPPLNQHSGTHPLALFLVNFFFILKRLKMSLFNILGLSKMENTRDTIAGLI